VESLRTGEWRPELTTSIPNEQLPPNASFQAGDNVRLSNGAAAVVKEITDKEIILDFNPQLSGKALNFEVELVKLTKVKLHPLLFPCSFVYVHSVRCIVLITIMLCPIWRALSSVACCWASIRSFCWQRQFFQQSSRLVQSHADGGVSSFQALPINFLAPTSLSTRQQCTLPHVQASHLRKATFGAGCFWGPELLYQRVPGVVSTEVGYSQGHMEDPTYEDVCSGGTGHTEVVQVCAH
jgi:hypothetical protein